MNHDTYFRGPSDHHTGLRTIRDSRDAFGFRFKNEPETRAWSNIKVVLIFLVLLISLAGAANAQAPELYDPRTGRYLGNMSANTLDPNSINNPLGTYGNPLNPYSVKNPVGIYGSPLSPYSITNPLSTHAPVIVAPGRVRRW